jgi:hypothetical protein
VYPWRGALQDGDVGTFGEAVKIVEIVGIVWIAAALLWTTKGVVFWLCRQALRMTRPIENRALLWLQDRACARTLGVDIDFIRARRKIDFPRH